jgi:hypothetical protein
MPTLPLMEEMLTIAPHWLGRIASAAYLVPSQAP